MDDAAGAKAKTRLVLGNDLRIGRASEVFDLLNSATGTVGTLVIDGSEVSKIDAAGLQALAAAIMRFRAAGTVWRWESRSAALAGAAKLLGLEGMLELQ